MLAGAGVITAAGGAGGYNGNFASTGAAGGNGRLLESANDMSGFSATQTGTVASAGASPMRANPYLNTDANSPFIPDLSGGAEAFGLSTLPTSSFPGLQANAPQFAGLALVREHLGGQYGPNFAGYDALFLVNVSQFSLSSVQLGAGAVNYLSPLKLEGFANDPAFGGQGSQVIQQLAAGSVYESLIPTATSNFNLSFQLNGQTSSASTATLAVGVPFYAQYTPLPTRSFIVQSLLGSATGLSQTSPYYSIFDAINDANKPYAGQSIVSFAPNVVGTIQIIQPGALSLSGYVTIQGPGAGVLAIDATYNGGGEIFQVKAGAFSSITGLTIENELYVGSNPVGGAISVATSSTLTLKNDLFTHNTAQTGGSAGSGQGGAVGNSGTLLVDHCTFANSQAGIFGGAIYNAGTLTLTDSTLAGNSAGDAAHPGSGGAIYNATGATATLVNDTISGNSLFSGRSGAGLFDGAGTLSIGNCIVAGNGVDIFGPVTSAGHNLIGNGDGGISGNWLASDSVGTTSAPLNPLLGPLGLYGGTLPTFPLLAQSGALDRGDNTLASTVGLTSDERGLARVFNTTVDIGAYEAQPGDPPANLSAQGGVGQVVLTWSVPNSADAIAPSSFNVYRSTSPGGEGTTPIATGITSGMFSDTSVAAGTSYFYQVTAVASGTQTALSNEAATATASPVINVAGNAPIYLSRDANNVNIDWSDSNNHSGFVPANAPGGLTINGDAGNDSLILSANGDPYPATLHLNGTFTFQDLPSLAGAALDIGRSTVYISYANNPALDPIAAIRTYLHNGYNGGAWNGSATATTGVITSAAAGANANHNTAIGYADFADGQGVNTTPNTIELTYTLYGDVNLDHQVNSADLQTLLFGLNRPGTWDQGDFNYDAQVNSADLQSLLFTLNTNLGNQTTPLAVAASAAVATTASMTTSSSSDPTSHLPPAINATGPATTPINHPHTAKVTARKRR